MSCPPDMEQCRCRLCGAETATRFRLQILKKHDVGFHRCTTCRSLQTDAPYWLDEAYADQRRYFDTGAVLRNQRLQAYVWYLVKLFRLGPEVTALDWGGSDGLFTRMMRDIGIDARHSDKYATNTYAAGFDDEPGRTYDLVTAFEVYEHLPTPAAEIEQIFARQPQVHLLTTSLYTDQGPDWPYIWPTTGRHVFFFSAEAMQLIGEKYGYRVLTAGNNTLFYRAPISSFRLRILRRVLSGQNQRFFRALFASRQGIGLSGSDRRLMMELKG